MLHAVGLPDMHTGYGFAIGNAVATDFEANGVICPGGIGFDINCGVRVLRTNLTVEAFTPETRERLAQELYNRISVGTATRDFVKIKEKNVDEILECGVDWAIREGYAWGEDADRCEEFGRMRCGVGAAVSHRARRRGVPQLGTLGSGNHYLEVQAVEEIHNRSAASCYGLFHGQVVVMLHTGSRGLGHQVATDALAEMPCAMAREGITVPDPQLGCAPINSPEGRQYYHGMCAAANFAFVNRSCVTHCVRHAFSQCFQQTPDEMELDVLYDVAHNVAKTEEHPVQGRPRTVLVHRKGATRSLGPFHPLVPVEYQRVGQPVLVGGSMGTCSWILHGTTQAMERSLATTCHGAGRAQSRSQSRRQPSGEVLRGLRDQGIALRCANPEMISEEAPAAYRDVNHVVDICEQAEISRKVAKLRPLIVIKG